MFAARREHLERVIRPALARGDWVLCDRFTDATFAYQGGGHGVPRERIRELEQWTHGECQPDLTLSCSMCRPVFRASGSIQRELAGRELDKFESEAMPFFTECAMPTSSVPPRCLQRFRVIDSTRPLEVVRAEARGAPAALGVAA